MWERDIGTNRNTTTAIKRDGKTNQNTRTATKKETSVQSIVASKKI